MRLCPKKWVVSYILHFLGSTHIQSLYRHKIHWETLVTVVLLECEKAACLRCQRAAKATHPVGEAALPHFISYCLCVILRLNAPAELQLPSTSALLRPQSLLFMYVCVCYENCHQRPVCVCVCQCAYERAPCQVTGNTEQAGVDRYEPDWAASFSWKLQRTHYNSSSHWWTMWHGFASLALIGSVPASPCPQLAQPCGVWHERGEGGGGREEGCYRHSDSKLQVTCSSHANSETTERMKEKCPLLQSCTVIRRHPASFIFLFLKAL